MADGISKPEELIETVLDHKAEIYHAAGGHAQKEEADTEEKAGVGHMIYTHLMSGVSHMLPFVIGGGIMTALAFLIDTLLGYGTVGGAAFGTCTPISAFFKYVGGLSLGLMVSGAGRLHRLLHRGPAGSCGRFYRRTSGKPTETRW